MLRIVAAVSCLLFTLLAPAAAQKWPERTVRIVVPYNAGGGTDLVARVLAQTLGAKLGQNFIVENKPGASGMIGAQLVAKGAADGYSLLVASPAEIALNQDLFKEMTYDPLTDLTPITLLAWTPLVLAAHPSFTASTTSELVKLAKSQSVDFSSPGMGSSHHLAGEIHQFSARHAPFARPISRRRARGLGCGKRTRQADDFGYAAGRAADEGR
jgi:tripartite-type tricarboxylate transporter receptor subunit TctC